MNRSSIHDELVDYFASLLRTPREQISTDVNVLDLGADSIMLLEARSWIESRTGRRIEIQQFFEELNTIAAIAAFLADAPPTPVADPASAAAPLPPAVRTPAAAPAVADLALMRAQLTLVAEVIEAQNRAVAARARET